MEKTLAVINPLEQQGLIGRYAIGEAVAATRDIAAQRPVAGQARRPNIVEPKAHGPTQACASSVMQGTSRRNSRQVPVEAYA